MRYLYCYYLHGALILKYTDENGYRTTHRYLLYTLREAIKLFRKRHGLRYKHITVKKYFDKSGGNK